MALLAWALPGGVAVMRLAIIPIPSTLPDGMLYHQDELSDVLDVAKRAEELGYDAFSMSEHVIMASRPDKYPSTSLIHRVDEPYPDPLVTLGAVAAVTSRIQLIAAVVIAPLRPAVLLAKQAATVHALSKGRFVMGVSTSWQEEEYEALGVPFHERGARLDDTISACRALWSGAPVSYSSPSVSFEDFVCVPRPEHPDDIPIWYGSAPIPRLLKRMARDGAGWMPFVGPEPKPFEMMARGKGEVEAAMREAGRDPSKLEVAALLMPKGRDLPTALAEDVPRFKEAGVTMIRVQISTFVKERAKVAGFMEELVTRFEPYR